VGIGLAEGRSIDVDPSCEEFLTFALDHVLDLLSQVGDTSNKADTFATEIEEGVDRRRRESPACVKVRQVLTLVPLVAPE
jgi:hypothetical protein